MPTVTLEPLRWAERPSRVTLLDAEGGIQAYFQSTSPMNVVSMCKGRPVEELPRILSILSPAHHLVAAAALDNLFGVEPPDPARTIREALRQAQFVTHHLRKLFCVLSLFEDPFREFSLRQVPWQESVVPHQMLDEVMHHLALAQEAAAILGGRADHPVSAVAGGVGRFLKEAHCRRLSEIAPQCLSFAVELAAFVRANILNGAPHSMEAMQTVFPPMSSLTAAEDKGEIVLADASGRQVDQFTPDKVFEKVGLRYESWTYEPFAFLKDGNGRGLPSENSDDFYFVGPLARLNSGGELGSPAAEGERLSLTESLGPFPHFTVLAAYGALLVELVQAAERMTGLCEQDGMTGPHMRNMPSRMNEECFAALESPSGLLAHHYTVDSNGLVDEVEVLDTAAQTNSLRCLLVQEAVNRGHERGESPREIKKSIEAILLPF